MENTPVSDLDYIGNKFNISILRQNNQCRQTDQKEREEGMEGEGRRGGGGREGQTSVIVLVLSWGFCLDFSTKLALCWGDKAFVQRWRDIKSQSCTSSFNLLATEISWWLAASYGSDQLVFNNLRVKPVSSNSSKSRNSDWKQPVRSGWIGSI